MKKLIFILLFILITSPLSAKNSKNPLQFAWNDNGDDEWTTQDTILQTVFISTLIIDAWQSYTFLYIGDYRERGFYETNPILGEHPSKKRFFAYWSVCAVGHSAISYILPKSYRSYWQCLIIGVESYYIYHNYKIGVRLSF